MAKYKNRSLFFSTGFKLLFLVTIAALITYGLKSYSSGTNVLGTSVFLADRGSDSGSSSNSGPSSVSNAEDIEEHENEIDQLEEEIESELNVQALNKVTFEAEDKTRIRLETRRSKLEITNDEDHLKIKAKHEDGTEIELEEEALDKINDELEEEDFEIATGSGNRFLLRRGHVEAQTHFPLSINPTTNELTVTTPAGTKVVAVLPDAAVEHLINLKFINVVASDSADTGVTLGVFQDQSAFEVKGLDKQKLLGFFPVDVEKVIYVSAENGKVLTVNQSLISRLLDFFSADQ